MLVTRFTRIPFYKVFEEIQDGKEVMCLNRAKLECFCITKLSVESAVAIIKDAEEAEKFKGDSFYSESQYEFWCTEIVDVKEDAECKAE